MSFRAELISDTHLNMWKYKPDELVKIFSLKSDSRVLKLPPRVVLEFLIVFG
jgi:hypothetical protein